MGFGSSNAQLLKKEFRKNLISDSSIIDRDDKENLDLQNQLIQYLKTQTGTWAAYKALSSEPLVDEAVAASSHLNWVYPKMEEEQIRFYKLSSKKFQTSKWGIDEPISDKKLQVETDDLNGLLIPGLAFDTTGVRLGRGRGLFDKALKNYKGQKVGIALKNKIYSEIPTEVHDVRMNHIVTAGGVIHCLSMRG